MDRGFTIIEMLLFISISGLIVLMVLVGFNSSIEANRRIDTNRSLEATIEAEYTSVQAGTVVRQVDAATGRVPSCITAPGPPAAGTYPGASNDCIILGKLLKIKLGSNTLINSYDVVANIRPTDPCTATGVRAIIDCYSPRVLDMSKPGRIVAPEWSSQITNVVFQSKVNASIARQYSAFSHAYVAILRDPTVEVVYITPLNLPNLTTGPQSLRNVADTDYPDYTNGKGQLCLLHQGVLLPRSYVLFKGGEGVGTISISTDPLLMGATSC